MHDPSRLVLVDALRGFALMGLFLVHMVELFELYWLAPRPDPAFDWTMAIFAGKAFALFALCFGLSFAIIMERARARGVDFTARFAWRLTILLLIGLLHGLVYRGEILQILALLGLSLLMFDRISDNRILVAFAILFLAQPLLLLRVIAAMDGAGWSLPPPLFMTDDSLAAAGRGSLADMVAANSVDGLLAKWSFYLDTGRLSQILGLFLVGLVLGRIGFFARPNDFRRTRRVVLVAAIAAALALTWIRPGFVALAPDTPEIARHGLGWMISGWIAIAAMAAQALLFVELFQSFAQPILRALAPVGRMTLTLYVGQSLMFVPIFYGFGLGLHETISEPQALAFGLLAFALQIAFAHAWFARFHYGPLEWLWRSLTYLRADLPFLKRPVAEAV